MKDSPPDHEGSPERCDVVIVGAGAAGLMAGIHAARVLGDSGRVIGLDGARRIGMKILVAGGGRCNVTHHQVRPEDYAGSSQPAIRKVLGRFPVKRTVEFFEELGVELKQESTGKLFPVTDRAKTVLGALLDAWRDAGAELRFPRRVESIDFLSPGFHIRGEGTDLIADRVILTPGGKALPKSGSDGSGYQLARSLGHTITDAVHPALVPLVLRGGSELRDLSGIAAEVGMEVRDGRGRRIAGYAAPLLCTHFGVSGPVVLDASRHLLAARLAGDAEAHVIVDWLPDDDRAAFEATLLGSKGGQTIAGLLRGKLPERMVLTLSMVAGLQASDRVRGLSREARGRLLTTLFEHRIPVEGDRGYTHAEATAGGVPLSEVRLDTMESRKIPGLHLAGEILDVDGRVGGFNFQWAWASGHLAGTAAAKAGTPQSPKA